MNPVAREQETGELRERLNSLASHFIPALISYGVGSVECAYEVGDTTTILGLQLRDFTGLRIGRGIVPVRLIASLEGWVALFAQTVEAGVSDGVVEVRLADRKVLCKLQRSGDDAVSIREWAW